MKYPLQKELEKDLNQAMNYVVATIDDPKAHEVATNFYNAIHRINEICVNRKRF